MSKFGSTPIYAIPGPRGPPGPEGLRGVPGPTGGPLMSTRTYEFLIPKKNFPICGIGQHEGYAIMAVEAQLKNGAWRLLNPKSKTFEIKRGEQEIVVDIENLKTKNSSNLVRITILKFHRHITSL